MDDRTIWIVTFLLTSAFAVWAAHSALMLRKRSLWCLPSLLLAAGAASGLAFGWWHFDRSRIPLAICVAPLTALIAFRWSHRPPVLRASGLIGTAALCLFGGCGAWAGFSAPEGLSVPRVSPDGEYTARIASSDVLDSGEGAIYIYPRRFSFSRMLQWPRVKLVTFSEE